MPSTTLTGTFCNSYYLSGKTCFALQPVLQSQNRKFVKLDAMPITEATMHFYSYNAIKL